MSGEEEGWVIFDELGEPQDRRVRIPTARQVGVNDRPVCSLGDMRDSVSRTVNCIGAPEVGD